MNVLKSLKDLQRNTGNSQMKLITFTEISRTILDCSLCSFILLLLLNLGIFFLYKVIRQLKFFTEKWLLGLLRKIFKRAGKAKHVKHVKT